MNAEAGFMASGESPHMEEAPTSPVDGASNGAEQRIYETLARIERDLGQLKDGLSLLGIRSCSHCRKFFRSSEPGTLFNAGELVCFGCIPDWWQQRTAQLNAKERDELESRLVHWLREYHRAEVIKTPNKLPEASTLALQMVANCLECHGSGVLMESERCRYCDGRGTVWIVSPKKL